MNIFKINILNNYICDLIIIWIFFFTYTISKYYSNFLLENTQKGLLLIAIIFSLIAIPVAIYQQKRNKQSKSYQIIHFFFRFLKYNFLYFGRKEKNKKYRFTLSETKKNTLLFFCVKLFYIPLMLQFSILNILNLKNQIYSFNINDVDFVLNLFSYYLFPIILTSLFLIDTLFFLFGYLFDADYLKNSVKSVDKSFLGWACALICYPPFNGYLGDFTTWYANDMAYFYNDTLTFILRIIICLLLIIYVLASVSLGTKCSNLTNRGIVDRGVYRFVRHPAYISKNLIWWITLFPMISFYPAAILSMLFWSFIYFLRAITEENHLLQDEDYKKYCQKVKYRFIPYVF